MTAPVQATRYDLGHGAWLDFWPRLVSDHPGSALDDSESGSSWLHYLRGELPLAPESYRIVGRLVTSPRLVSWHGDADTGYVYSGVRHAPKPWTPGLAQLRMRIEKVTGLTFNSVLANLYRTGSDGMGWHADAEPEIGPSPADRWVASLSFGEPRRFILRHRSGTNKHELLLGHGDLLVMRGTTQREYRHSVPKTKQPVGPRLNLTFRHVICTGR